jgi:hypothetical protein
MSTSATTPDINAENPGVANQPAAAGLGSNAPPPPDVSNLPANSQTAQAPQTPPLQPGPAAHRGILSDILHAVGDALGGPKTQQTVDPATGNIVEKPTSTAQRISQGIARGIVGAGAGIAEHGPGALGRSVVAGANSANQANQQQKENTLKQSENVRQGLEQKATIAYHNNQMLLQQREADRMDTEMRSKIADSNRQFGILAQENGFQKPPIIMGGKDINGQPGNEADMMKYFSDPQNHKAPDGYAYMYVPTTTEDGKAAHEVWLAPINAMKQPVTLTAQQLKDQTGIDSPGANATVLMQDLIALRAKKTADDLQTAQEQRAETAAKEQTELLPLTKKHLQAETNNLQSEADKNIAEAKALGTAQVDAPDLSGFKPDLPPGGIKEYNKRVDSFKTDISKLTQTEGSYQQFQDVLNDINSGKDMTGAQSVVGLFNAIGLSAEPLRGKGMRITQNVVADHQNARSFGQDLYQKWLSLKKGDIITPQQIKDYANIASNVRTNEYVNLINQMHADGVKADPVLGMLQGKGRQIDPGTARIFLGVTGDPQKARDLATKQGWTVPQTQQAQPAQ